MFTNWAKIVFESIEDEERRGEVGSRMLVSWRWRALAEETSLLRLPSSLWLRTFSISTSSKDTWSWMNKEITIDIDTSLPFVDRRDLAHFSSLSSVRWNEQISKHKNKWTEQTTCSFFFSIEREDGPAKRKFLTRLTDVTGVWSNFLSLLNCSMTEKRSWQRLNTCECHVNNRLSLSMCSFPALVHYNLSRSNAWSILRNKRSRQR